MSAGEERPGNGPGEAPARRRPGRVRRWVVRPFIWGLVLLAVLIAAALVFLQSRYARHQLAARLIAAVSEKIGRPVEVGDVDYTFFPLSLELHDVVIPGPTPGERPVARIPLARVQATWRDLRQRVVRLDQVEAVRPEIYVRIDPDGSTNLPRWRTERQGPRRFEVQIGRILVQDGTFQLNERRVPLRVDARAVWGRVLGQADRAGEGGERLDALVTAQEVVTRLPDANPWPATVSAKATIVPSEGRLHITSARIAGPDLQAQVEGTVQWKGEEKRVSVDIDANGATPLLNRLGYLKEPIEGLFAFQGSARVQGRQVLYGGTVTSPRMAILDREFRGIEAQLSGGRERLEVDLLRAEYAGGRIEGPISIPFQDEGRPGTAVEMELTLAGLGLQPLLQDQFPGEDIPVVSGLAGRVRGTLAYDFDSREPLGGSGFADLRVEAVQQAGGLPLAGDLPIDIEEGVLSSGDLRITAPGQDLRIDGFQFDLQRLAGRLAYRLESRDLGRLAPLLLEDVPPGEDTPFWLPTQGQGVLNGDVTIDRTEYVALVQLDLRNAVTPDLAAETVRGSLRLRPGAVEDLQLALSSGGASGPGSLTVSGRVPLAEEGRTAPTEPMSLQIAADRWPAASVARFLLPPDADWPVGGQVTGRLALRGVPDALQGEATAEVAGLTIAEQRVGQAQAEIAFEGARIRLRRVAIQTEAGNILASGVFDGAAAGPDGGGTLDFTVDAPALALAAPPFRDLLGGRLDGRLAIGAVIGGTVERPEATVRLVGTQLALAGRPLGENGNPGTAQALLAWDGDNLRATGSLLGLVSFDGGGRLDRAGADLAFDVSTQDLAALARLASPQPVPDFTGSFLGTLGFDADFASGSWEGELRLADLRLQYEDHEIASLEPVVVALGPQRLTIESLYLGEARTESELFASGTVGLGGATTPLDLRLQSTISAAWLELFAPQLDVGGAVDLLATVRGTVEAPVLNGQGEIRDAHLVIPNFPHELEDIRGTLLFNRDAVELEGLRARFGGGELQAAGRLELPEPGEPLEYRLQVAAEDLSLRYPEGFLARGDANLTFVSSGDSRVIRGEVRLNRLFYVEDVELGTLELLRGAFQRQRVEVAETDEFLAATQLNVRVTGPNALRVNNNVANLRGDLDLFVRGTLANPVLFGQVELDPGGELIYADNEYEVERGLLTFNNPYRIDPVIDLVARTEVRNYDISLTLAGTLERLNAQFSSEEGLADLEILALLATGQELPGEGRFTAPGERTESDVRAGALLAGQAASLVTSRVGTLFGFDRFRIDPQPNPSGGAIGGVRLTVGKRISRDLFVTYTSNPSSSEEYVVRVEWQLSDRVLLVLTRDGKEDLFALDAEWEKRF
jgi:translocation and assembly module TamB